MQSALALRYEQMRARARVRESALFPTQRTPSELELQARWFAGDFGTKFISTAGDKIEIVQFGTWNREPGPDFRDAAISINNAGAIRGCIELDLLDRSWEAHGHSTNPAFEETVLHVFFEKSDREFFARTPSNRNVPQVRIDLAGFPGAVSTIVPLARPGRCQAPLKDASAGRIVSLLDSAAQFRLRRKAARIRNTINTHGQDETLFQELAASLGYKENKLPFTLIAQRLTLKFLRRNESDIEALLFGVAGFLEAPDLNIYQGSTRNYVRVLWDRWWPYREQMNRLVLAPKIWRKSGTRPVNHPQRRLAALAAIVHEWNRVRRTLDKFSVDGAEKFFAALDHPFWKTHYTLTSKAADQEMALIGESRIAEILANIIVPFWSAKDADIWPQYTQLRARLSNRTLETGAIRLFGDDPRRSEFLKTVAHQQGLLQIYEDFCLQDNSDCANCPFPEQMQKWSSGVME